MERSKGFTAYLATTAALCGALVMVIDMLGVRVISPLYGISLFVWASMITMTLGALAAGYAIGGYLSDRKSSPDWLYGIILISGIAVILIPELKSMVLPVSLPLGLRWGALVSAFVLFGFPLFLLGCAFPYLVRIAVREMHTIGRTVGMFYAISMVGSLSGALLTGFVLITYFGLNSLFLMAGSLLIGVGGGYFVFFRRKWVVVLVMLCPLFLVPHWENIKKTMADGTRVELLASRDSLYGNLRVVDYSYQQKHQRELIIDGQVRGWVDVVNGMSLYEYPYLLQFIPYALNPDGKECLVIGLGAGMVPSWYQAQGVHTEVVDADPRVAELARHYFNFNPAIPVYIQDARHFLASTTQRYDYLILDVFSGDTTASHLLSVEAMRQARQRLAPGGVIAINLIGSVKYHTLMTASVVKTLRGVFDQVVVYPAFDPAVGDGIGNLEIVAYDGAPRPLRFSRINSMDIHPAAESLVRLGMGKPFLFPSQTPALVLSDDYNPMDSYNLWLNEQVRKMILDISDIDILLS